MKYAKMKATIKGKDFDFKPFTSGDYKGCSKTRSKKHFQQQMGGLHVYP